MLSLGRLAAIGWLSMCAHPFQIFFSPDHQLILSWSAPNSSNPQQLLCIHCYHCPRHPNTWPSADLPIFSLSLAFTSYHAQISPRYRMPAGYARSSRPWLFTHRAPIYSSTHLDTRQGQMLCRIPLAPESHHAPVMQCQRILLSGWRISVTTAFTGSVQQSRQKRLYPSPTAPTTGTCTTWKLLN